MRGSDLAEAMASAVDRIVSARCREENRPQAQTVYNVCEPALTRGHVPCRKVDR